MKKGALAAPFCIDTRAASLVGGGEIGRRVLAAVARDLVFYFLAFVERSHISALDGGDMDEHVVAAILRFDEAVALLGIEPFDRADSQASLHHSSPWKAHGGCAIGRGKSCFVAPSKPTLFGASRIFPAAI